MCENSISYFVLKIRIKIVIYTDSLGY